MDKDRKKYIDDDSTDSGEIKSKFRDRLNKIRLNKLSKNAETLSYNMIKNFFCDVRNILLALPLFVYDHIKFKNKNNLDKNVVLKKVSLNHAIDFTDKEKFNIIKNMDVPSLKRKSEKYYNNSGNLSTEKFNSVNTVFLKNDEVNTIFKETAYDIDKFDRIRKLQKEIIDLIKKKLVININELEILQSELYVLNEIDNSEIFLKNCKENVVEIKKLLSKIKAIKEKYDYLKDNVDFEYLLEYDDGYLADKIIEYRDLCDKIDLNNLVDNYKLLDEYKYLYLKIDKLYDDTIRLEDYKENKIQELREREIDFEDLKNNVYDIDRDSEKYLNFIEKQNLLLKELDDEIDKINTYEIVDYHLKGFNKLLGNSFKYLGLLLASPLKGLVPGIVTQTVVTKNIINNLYNNLEWEENRKIIYDTIDYSSTIRMAINNIDNTEILINNTLEDVINLKVRYQKQFGDYERDFPGYKDAIKKINKIENALMGSKIKMNMIRLRMQEKEKQNNNKLKQVKKLNN